MGNRAAFESEMQGVSPVCLQQRHAKAPGGDRTGPGQPGLRGPSWAVLPPTCRPLGSPAQQLTDQVLILVFDRLPLPTVTVD